MAIILLWFLYAMTTLMMNSCIMVQGNMSASYCNGKDQYQLLAFKQGIKDPSNKLSSWSIEQDCCNWIGVKCDNSTKRVTKLDLHCPLDPIATQCLDGEINFSTLLQLEFLTLLDLSSNDFKVIHFPPITNPSTSLLYLDLSKNYNLHMKNLEWVTHLSSLKYLNLSGILFNDNNETLWLQYVIRLPSLAELRLSGCTLNNSNNKPIGYVNFTSLEVIDVSNNSFNSEIPKWLFNLSSSSISYMDLSSNNLQGQIPSAMLNFQNLKSLILRDNHLKGLIPKWIGQYKHLKQLDLSKNSFYGPIPSTFGNLTSLESLDVSFNHLNGTLPIDIESLFELESLSMGFNSFSGIISEMSFAKLSNLKSLSLDSSNFTFNLSSNWNPPFQLELISISYCTNLGPEFPSWIYSQRSLSYLDVSGSELEFNVHDDFWSFVAEIDHLFLSDNRIGGDISSYLINNIQIDLKWNKFSGGLPHLSQNVEFFDIANNSFSGPLFPLLCQTMSTQQHTLKVLDMSHNFFSGDLTDCWANYLSLLHANIASNNLIGVIPDSLGLLTSLQTFRVRNNSLSGTIPISLKGCKSLWYLDLGFNEFKGEIPNWFTNLSMAILLRSNKFHGTIPLQLCQLSTLLVLDLANNRISGLIPKCLNEIKAMMTYSIDRGLFNSYFAKWDSSPVSVKSHLEDLPLLVKGLELNYWSALKFVRMIDLSRNELSGLIPKELFGLIALQSLNLSHNRLIGKIPSDIQHMRFLESLDLSRNKLSGEIPESMSNLSFLSYLNLSYNHFNGRIPLGTQLQSFEANSYIGNPDLCGAPLPKNCTQEEDHQNPVLSRSMDEYKNNDDDDDFTSWFEIGIGVGFGSAFCCVFGTLCLFRRWRHFYFRTLDKLYAIIAVKIRRML